jgi:ubiquinone/menaquinone biosynthesis C-methylase UbiE
MKWEGVLKRIENDLAQYPERSLQDEVHRDLELVREALRGEVKSVLEAKAVIPPIFGENGISVRKGRKEQENQEEIRKGALPSIPSQSIESIQVIASIELAIGKSLKDIRNIEEENEPFVIRIGEEDYCDSMFSLCSRIARKRLNMQRPSWGLRYLICLCAGLSSDMAVAVLAEESGKGKITFPVSKMVNAAMLRDWEERSGKKLNSIANIRKEKDEFEFEYEGKQYRDSWDRMAGEIANKVFGSRGNKPFGLEFFRLIYNDASFEVASDTIRKQLDQEKSKNEYPPIPIESIDSAEVFFQIEKAMGEKFDDLICTGHTRRFTVEISGVKYTDTVANLTSRIGKVISGLPGHRLDGRDCLIRIRDGVPWEEAIRLTREQHEQIGLPLERLQNAEGVLVLERAMGKKTEEVSNVAKLRGQLRLVFQDAVYYDCFAQIVSKLSRLLFSDKSNIALVKEYLVNIREGMSKDEAEIGVLKAFEAEQRPLEKLLTRSDVLLQIENVIGRRLEEMTHTDKTFYTVTLEGLSYRFKFSSLLYNIQKDTLGIRGSGRHALRYLILIRDGKSPSEAKKSIIENSIDQQIIRKNKLEDVFNTPQIIRKFEDVCGIKIEAMSSRNTKTITYDFVWNGIQYSGCLKSFLTRIGNRVISRHSFNDYVRRYLIMVRDGTDSALAHKIVKDSLSENEGKGEIIPLDILDTEFVRQIEQSLGRRLDKLNLRNETETFVVEKNGKRYCDTLRRLVERIIPVILNRKGLLKAGLEFLILIRDGMSRDEAIEITREKCVRIGQEKVQRVNRLESQQKSEIELGHFLNEVVERKTMSAEAFAKLLEVFGMGEAVDLLFRFHPRFKFLPTGRVKKILSEYLGDFQKPLMLSLDDVHQRIGDIPFDSDLSHRLKATLFEIGKRNALRHVSERKRTGDQRDELCLIQEYLEEHRQRFEKKGQSEVWGFLDDVSEYYRKVLAFEKPSNLVDSLSGDRFFPDLNQRINVIEVKKKKRLLIADEMGLGKSASAILSKETLGARCALVIVPANTIPTWRRYLSDRVDANGRQIGYFEGGMAPGVLEISDPSDIPRIDEGYDYILISQEKIRGGVVPATEINRILKGVDSESADRLRQELWEDLPGFSDSKIFRFDSLDEVHCLPDWQKLNPEAKNDINAVWERYQDGYAASLRRVDYDMMIVDEVHKFKNVRQGTRTRSLLQLSRKIEGDDSYLVLLSGTPVPNKVSDMALLLKLLYPQEYADTSNEMLISNILNGDLIDLRHRLMMAMEKKQLAESIPMPDLHRNIEWLTLSDSERDIYEILLEEDEMPAFEKIRVLRQFLLNPKLLNLTPGIKSVKSVAVSRYLSREFASHNKVLMFVNGFVEGVIRGEETILSDLDIPSGVRVRVIHGDTSRRERESIQKEMNQQTADKALFVVSSQTADVGVDFSGIHSVCFLNKSWTESEERQLVGRVWRPGQKNEVNVTHFMTRGTIGEGITRFVEEKQKIIEKLLNGISLAEFEKDALVRGMFEDPFHLEVNPQIGWSFLSDWQRLMKIFGKSKDIGEREFRNMILPNYGEIYADSYKKLIGRSYQSNNARVVAMLFGRMTEEQEQERGTKNISILDIASGPELLRRHAPKGLQESITSIDLNDGHFHNNTTGRAAVASMKQLPFADRQFDFANLAFAFHYARWRPESDDFERLQVLTELNRILKSGGRGVISMIYSIDFSSPDAFQKLVQKLGFSVCKTYSGEASAGDRYFSRIVTLEKTAEIPKSLFGDKDALGKYVGNEVLDGLLLTTNYSRKLKDTKTIIDNFYLDGIEYHLQLNAWDAAVQKEQESILAEMKRLMDQYGSVRDIPNDVVKKGNLMRFWNGKRFVLFKKMQSANSIVDIKD